jgi:hypothetical protein
MVSSLGAGSGSPGQFSDSISATPSRLSTCKDDCSHGPPIPRRCNAHTRAGRLCSHGAGQRTTHPGEGRCFLHGGGTPRGIESPHFRHGTDSKYFGRQRDADAELYRAVTFVQELAIGLRDRGPLEVLYAMRSMPPAECRELADGLERMAAGGWIFEERPRRRRKPGVPAPEALR